MLTHALRYAAMGWPVFPLTGKAPLTPHGSKDCCTTESVIRDWWARWPNANIGLATGYKFFVLDVDDTDTIEALEVLHGKLPDTIQQITGSGGRHYLFSLPTNTHVKNSASKIGSGMDIRGEGGYIVAEPSIHPQTLQAYRFDGLAEIEDQQLLPAPEWLLKLCGEQASEKFVLPNVITPGNRNDILFHQASNMRGAGMAEEEIFEALLSTNTKRVSPPLPTNELRAISKSVMRYQPNEIRKKSTVRKALNEHIQAGTTFSAPGEKVEPTAAWAEKLDRNLQDIPHKNIRNVRVVLEYNPHWHGAFAWNDFSHQIVTTRSLCGGSIESGIALQDFHVTLINSEIQERTQVNVSTELIFEGISAVARCNSFHPVRDYLRSLQHDSEGRADNWLNRYLGVRNSNYSAAIGRRWLISAVARVMSPGCKADCCLILEGAQGIGKSTALNILGGHWFTDDMQSLCGSDKDSKMQMRGKWIIEIGELSALNRGEVNAVKAFMSRSIDNYRVPYGKSFTDVPRECVFAGTTNSNSYLKDDENRRFWPVQCGAIDLNGLVRDRDQIWAEAYQMWQDGEVWHLNDLRAIREAKAEQASRLETDPWHETIESWCADQEMVTMDNVLSHCIRKPKEQWSQGDKLRVSRTLRQIGYKVKLKRVNGTPKWVYVSLHDTDSIHDSIQPSS